MQYLQTMTPFSESTEKETTTNDAPHSRRDARTQALLTAPLLPMLLRLAAPNLVLVLVQQAVGLIEIFWIGRLGTASLAGVTLVFPLLSIMQAMAAGAIGGGISSSIARRLGRGRREEADALATHALIISAALGFIFMVMLFVGGLGALSSSSAAAANR